MLTSQLFYKDNGPDSSDAKTRPNSGLFNRYLATTGGKYVYLENPLFVDLFQQSRVLVNSGGIKLWPSLDTLRLISDSRNADQKVQIVDVRFKLYVQRLNEGVLVAHEKPFQEQPATYPYLRSEIKTTSIAPGQYGFSFDDIFQELVPYKLIVCWCLEPHTRGTTNIIRSTFSLTTAVKWDCTQTVSIIRRSLYNLTTVPISS